MNDDISRLLHDAAPEGPNPNGWADGARRRSTRRRTIGGAVAVVAAAALILPLAVTMGGSRTTTVQETPSSSNAPQLQSLQPAACIASDGGLPDSTLFAGHTLPEGAVRLWLCAQVQDGLTLLDDRGVEHEPFAAVGPPEALTIDVEDAVAAFNALELSDGSQKKCAPSLDPEKAVVVEYPDGQREVLTEGGCNVVGGRVGWYDLFSTLRGLWDRQRSFEDDKFTAEVQVCPGTNSILDPTPAEAVRGYVCPRDPSGSEGNRQRPLSPALVGDIVKEVSGGMVSPAVELPQPGSPAIVLLNVHGDPVSLQKAPATGTLPAPWLWTERQETYLWTPSNELAARLNDVLAEDGTAVTTESPATPTPPATPSIPDGVADVSFRQEAVAGAHPDVFAGWDFSDDGQAAELLYAQDHQLEAEELAAEFASDGDLSVLVPRTHSWTTLLTQRHAVQTLIQQLGIEVIEVVPDPRDTDGILLVVAPEKLNADATVGSPSDWDALTAAGVEVAEALEVPEAREIAGVPVIQEPRGWFSLQTSDVITAGSAASEVLSPRSDIYADAAYSTFFEYLKIWVKEGRLPEAEELLANAGVDLDLIRLVSTSNSFEELQAMVLPLMAESEDYGLEISGGHASAQHNGVVLGLLDPEELVSLTIEQVRRLKDMGLVGVEGQGIAMAMPLYEPSVEPTES